MSNAISTELINIQNSTAQANASKERKTEMDQDAFLQLLMIQLKNQDPTNPMDSSEFLAQQAQFTQISELQKLNNNLTSSMLISQASSMVGRDVVVEDKGSPEGYVKGVVECASFDSSGGINLVINGTEYPLDSLLIMGGQTTATEQSTSENN